MRSVLHGRCRRAAASLLALVVLALVPAAHAQAAPTVVSLTLDDGTATQYQARALLASHNMKATFYVNSSRLGSDSYYMTWSQVDGIAADGNEIGGHTAYHIDVPNTDATEAARQICNDRVNLLNRGYDVRNFAYPFGSFNASAQQIVRNCGYNSARSTNQFVPPPSETMPPQDPFAIRVAGSAGTSVSLATMKSYVTRVEQNGGGWAPLVFHQICNACDSNSISPADFAAFLDWLQPRTATGTVVKTVGDVIGGATQPAVPGPAAPPAPNGVNALRNASLEQDANGDATPDCWDFDNWGSNTYSWTRTTDAHSGSAAERLNISGYKDGDGKLVVTRDMGFCTPSVTPNHQYKLTAWYKSNAPVAFVTSKRDTLGTFTYWDTSPSFPASSTWTQASWITTRVPTGITGANFGLTLASNGSVTVDDLGFDDAAGSGSTDTSPPTATLTAPADGASIGGTTRLSATAADNVGVDHVDFLVDGTTVGTATSSPYEFNWNSRTVGNGTHAIRARAVDLAGNLTTTPAANVTVSNDFTNLLQNSSLELGAGAPTCWLLGGYGTNAFAWTRTSDAHSGLSAEKLDITAFTDGDRKMVTTQDTGTCAPVATPGHIYTVNAYYKSNAPARLFAYYRSSAGVWTYWASATYPAASTWTKASWTSPALPDGATHISVGMGLSAVGSITMDDFELFDNAPPPDTTPPTSSIACNSGGDSAGCQQGFYAGTVSVALTAADDAGGSGLKEIRYTTDGSTPTATTGTVYSGPFSVASTTTVKYRAFDIAGNAEAVNSQLIQVDPTAPTSSIACNGAACAGGYYTTAVSVTLNAADETGGSGLSEVRYTTDGSTPTATTGTVYSGAFSVASTTTVKYRAFDNAGNAEAVNSQLIQIDTAPPTVSMTAPTDGATVTGTTTLTASASDNAGIDHVDFLVDGTVISSDSTAPYSAAWDSTSVPDGPHSITARAVDVSTNAATSGAVSVAVYNNTPPPPDTTAPSSSIACDAAACASGYYGAAVSVTLAATDTGGSGLKEIRYTTDGSTPTATTGTVYSGAFSVGSTTTVKYRAFDNTGNAEPVNSQLIQVDTTAPASTVKCDAAACASTYYGAAVSVTLSAADTGGAGLKEIRYTTDGSTPTATTGTVYSSAFSVGSTTTVKYRAFDNAGNAEAVNSQQIQIDTTGPTVAITTPTNNTNVTATVKITANAADAASGLAKVTFYVDNTVLATVTAAPWTTNWNTKKSTKGVHTLTAVAEDKAGNKTTSAAVTVTVK